MKTLKEAKELLAYGKEFNAGNLTANIEQGVYVVRSYGVVIAWIDDFHIEIDPKAHSHSNTTSHHANIVRSAWSSV